jgi:peptide/nickel transport system substrate-binding protein
MTLRPTWRTLLTVLFALGLVASACSDGDDVDLGEDTDTTSSETDDAAGDDSGDDSDSGTDDDTGDTNGGDSILIAAQGAEPDRLDPHFTSAYASFQVLENVYDTLVQPGDDLTMEPAIAESWEVSDDNLTWTFSIREGVVFHNGRDLVADDVVYSLDRIRTEEGTGAGWRLGSVDTITAPDDSTVVVTLTAPTPNLLVSLGGYKGLAIVPSEIVDDGSIDTSPVGTGPFRFVSQSADGGIVLERNSDYWRSDEGLPYLDGINFVAIPDPTVKLTNLEAGEVDWVDSVPPQSLSDLESSDSVDLQRVAGGDYHYFALNQNKAPFDDVRVRQAIATAIDRAEIAEAAQFGAASANQTAIPAGSAWYYDYSPFGLADTDSAAALLDEAGVNDLTIEFLVSSDFPETVTQAQVISAELAEIGVAVDIADVDFNTWLERQGNGEFDAFMLSWIGNIDPDEFYYAQHHSTGNFNFQGYSNPDVDALLDAARIETDQAARKGLYDQAAALIVDEASYIYLYNPQNVQAWTPSVSGFNVRGDNAVRFVETQLEG